MVKLVLIDTRVGSPTEGTVNEFFIGVRTHAGSGPVLVYQLEVHQRRNFAGRDVPNEPYPVMNRTKCRLSPRPRWLTTGRARMVKVLVTGGAGFIGSNFVRHAIAAHDDWHVTTLGSSHAPGASRIFRMSSSIRATRSFAGTSSNRRSPRS
jgi:hypothetical protein